MEQNKIEDTKTATWSLLFQVKPEIPNPKYCLAQSVFCWPYYQVRRLMKLDWYMEKLLLVGCWAGQFKF